MATKKINFEKSLKALEAIVQSMESGELSLEESLSTFEKGVQLTKQCQSALQEAEQRVQLLIQENGQTTRQDFEPSEEN